MMYTFAGAGRFGEYGEGRAFYEHYQLNSERFFFFFSCFQCDELVFVLVVEERAAVAGALANRPFCAQVDAQKRLLKICPIGAKLV